MNRTIRTAVPALAAAALLASGCAATSTAVKTTPAQTAPASAGASSAGAKTAAPKAAKVGDTITIKGANAGSRIDVAVVKVVDPAAGGNQFETPAAGNRYVAVQLRLKNTGTGAYSDDPDIEVAAIDASGQQYDAAFVTSTSAGVKMGSSVNIAPGGTVLGFEVFEVPKAERLVAVQYKLNIGLAGDVAQWSVG